MYMNWDMSVSVGLQLTYKMEIFDPDDLLRHF